MSVQIDGSTGNIIAIKADYSGDVSIGGTLTYEDVTNIDAVGLITARNGIKVDDLGVQVGTGATIDGATNTLTFLTNGSERLRVTSDGKVGINTDMGGAPASLYPFSVYRSTGTGYVYTETAQSGASAGLRAKAGTSDFTIFTTQGTGQLAVYDNTNTAERLRLDSSGRLLLGTTTEGDVNADDLTIANSGNCGMTIRSGTSSSGGIFFSDGTSGDAEYRGQVYYDHNSDYMRFSTAASERMRIDSSGRLLVGATSARENYFTSASGQDLRFQVEGTDYKNSAASFTSNSTSAGHGPHLAFGRSRGTSTGSNTIVNDGDTLGAIVFHGNDGSKFAQSARIDGNVNGTPGSSVMPGTLRFSTSPSSVSDPIERMRIDSSGRLLISGEAALTSTSLSHPVQIAADSSAQNIVCYGRATDDISAIDFYEADKTTNLGEIQYRQDHVNFRHRVGYISFATGGVTERMRITSSGDVTTTGTSTFSRANVGFTARNGDSVSITRAGGTPLEINRLNNDGNLVNFFQDGSVEGIISVSGSTVTYGGGHLARWSQLAGGAERIEILRGSVLSNLNEMCEWGEEDNEQLNRMKVSDVEGDVNVSGVFVRWDDDDEIYTNDFFCAMTGDFVIRIAQGTTVARGDLLMSAGDGTAKPQDDDIVRSKTIAKVTSTTVSATYSDGSYCVPCVLIAC